MDLAVREQVFGFGQTIDWLADPDQDGLSNQLEYALDRNPLRFDSMPAVTTSEDGKITVGRIADRPVAMIIEFSSDLQTWTTALPAAWALHSESATGVTYIPGAAPREVFLRVRAYW